MKNVIVRRSRRTEKTQGRILSSRWMQNRQTMNIFMRFFSSHFHHRDKCISFRLFALLQNQIIVKMRFFHYFSCGFKFQAHFAFALGKIISGQKMFGYYFHPHFHLTTTIGRCLDGIPFFPTFSQLILFFFISYDKIRENEKNSILNSKVVFISTFFACCAVRARESFVCI